jgi:hypothetical protein
MKRRHYGRRTSCTMFEKIHDSPFHLGFSSTNGFFAPLLRLRLLRLLPHESILEQERGVALVDALDVGYTRDAIAGRGQSSNGLRKLDGEASQTGRGGGHGCWTLAGCGGTGWSGRVWFSELKSPKKRHHRHPIGIGSVLPEPRLILPRLGSSRHQPAWSVAAVSPADCPRGWRC